MVEAELRGYMPVGKVAFMIDQSHCVKDPMEELIESLENIETAYAKALLVDYKALREAQDAWDPTLADRILQAAFSADIRPIKIEARQRRGLPLDPLAAARKAAFGLKGT
jgi:L-rhamnose isomerase/sugar isomerase